MSRHSVFWPHGLLEHLSLPAEDNRNAYHRTFTFITRKNLRRLITRLTFSVRIAVISIPTRTQDSSIHHFTMRVSTARWRLLTRTETYFLRTAFLSRFAIVIGSALESYALDFRITLITVITRARNHMIGYITVSVLSARKLIWGMAQVLALSTQTFEMTRTVLILSTASGAETILTNMSLKELIQIIK